VPLIESFYKGVPVLAFSATAVPATMDGGGVLYGTKDPFEVSRLMAAVLEHPDLEEAVLASQEEALARLRRKDFAGTLLRFVDRLIALGPRQAPEVPWDFWPQFDQAERLEELRQFRPALYRALPKDPASGMRDAGSGHADSANQPHLATQLGAPFGPRVPDPASRP
jgi:hypothetical protein